MKRKLLISFQFIQYFPIIFYRYIKFIILKKKLGVKEFKPSNLVCFEGAMNQLIWTVENSIFNILDSSPKIYLNSSDLIFKISSGRNNFTIKSYGYNKIQESKTKVQIVNLKYKSFDDNRLHFNNLTFEKMQSEIVLRNNIQPRLKRLGIINPKYSKSIIISNKINKIQLANYNEPIEQIIKVDKTHTIEQLINHQYE